MSTATLIEQKPRTRYGKGRIADTIMSITNASAPKQLGLYEELALAKAMLQDAVNLYEQISDGINSPTKDLGVLTKLFQSLAMMQPPIRAMLETVRSVAKTATDIEMSVAIQPDMLAYLAQRIEQVIAEQVTDEETRTSLEHGLMTAFAETTIRSQQTQHVILSPYDTVKAIDEAVPQVPCDEQSYATRLKATAVTDEQLPSWEDYSDLEQTGDQSNEQ